MTDRWLAATPDMARWIEVRSMLLSGDAETVGSPEAGFVVGYDLLGMVGRPDETTAERALSLAREGSELLVVPEALDHSRFLFPDRRPQRAILHLRKTMNHEVPAPAVEVARVDERFLGTLPPGLASEAEGARLAAVWRTDGEAVAMCAVRWITETLWDVAIDTLEGHRRRGYARSCFHALDAEMTSQGKRPVWGAFDDNVASLSMAASLGFEAVDELWVVDLEGLAGRNR